MKSTPRDLLQSFVKWSLPFLTLMILCCCSGGTTGTDSGGKQVQVRGALLFDSGEPASGFTITVLETGDNSQTDANGNFRIQTTRPIQGRLSLLIENEQAQSEVDIGEIPDQDTVADVQLQFNSSALEATVTSVNIRPIDPSETATPQNSEDIDSSTGNPGGETEMPPSDPTPRPSADPTPEPGSSGGANEDSDRPSDPTPDRPSLIQGVIENLSSREQSGVSVKIVGLPASTETNADGRFELKSVLQPGPVSLRIKYKDASTTVRITDVDTPPVNISVQIRIELIGVNPNLPGAGDETVLQASVGNVSVSKP